jgi:V-type H+-transporting ATPase subunit C
MADYLFVGVPTETGSSKTSTFKTLRDRATPLLADVFELRIPETLKVGTQDSLVSAVEELHKLDTMSEQVASTACMRIVQSVCSLLQNIVQSVYLTSIFQVLYRFEKEFRSLDSKFDLKLDGTTLQSYLCNFVWNESRFTTTHRNAHAMLNFFKQEIHDKDGYIKTLAAAYNAARQTLDGLLRKGSGTLQSRSLADLVRKEDIIPPSEYIVAVFVVVSSNEAKKFEQTYDTLTNFVVPDSMKQVCTEGDFVLYRVVLFKNVLKEYKDKARELKWVVREYEHSDSRQADETKEKRNAELALENAAGLLKKSLASAYPDMFIICAHLKILRVQCESILRFGMPQSSQFCTAVLLLKRGKMEELRRTLNELYKHLADDAFIASEEELVANVEVFPYVSFPLNVHGPEFRDL